MRVMVMVKASSESEAGVMPDEEILAAMTSYNEELVRAGILLAADGLHPSSDGKRVRISGNERTVIDGPFDDTSELLAGYWLWEVKSMQEALDWAKRCPNPHPGQESEIELRPVFELDEFPEATGDIHARVTAVREQVAAQDRP
jgi:hypothetical protein